MVPSAVGMVCAEKHASDQIRKRENKNVTLGKCGKQVTEKTVACLLALVE